MGNLSGFDANQVEPSRSFDPLPPGDYEVIIVSSEMKLTRKGGEMLQLELEVVNHPHQGRKIWDRLNLVCSSEVAQEIARGTLSSICRAVGVLTPSDSSELHNRVLIAKVGIEVDDQYGDKNYVKSYAPRKQAMPAVPPAAAAPKAPLSEMMAPEDVPPLPPRTRVKPTPTQDRDIPF